MSKQTGNKKRERGANYTPEEKTMLAEIIMQYKHIIEDKRTGGLHISKKKEAWAVITNKYNSSCTSGRRETEQLKALYDNMKQKARKNIGESNKLEYIQNKLFPEIDQNEQITEEDVARALKNIKEDKIQVNKTGGGLYKTKTTDSDTKILAIIQDQVEPLPNHYDSAAVFFKDDVNFVQEVNLEFVEETDVQPVVIVEEENSQNNIFEDNFVEQEKENKPIDINRITPRKIIKSKKLPAVQQKLKKNLSAEALKRIYFKKKCENAYLERKNIMLDILHKKKEHNLKMMLLKKKIESFSK